MVDSFPDRSGWAPLRPKREIFARPSSAVRKEIRIGPERRSLVYACSGCEIRAGEPLFKRLILHWSKPQVVEKGGRRCSGNPRLLLYVIIRNHHRA